MARASDSDAEDDEDQLFDSDDGSDDDDDNRGSSPPEGPLPAWARDWNTACFLTDFLVDFCLLFHTFIVVYLYVT